MKKKTVKAAPKKVVKKNAVKAAPAKAKKPVAKKAAVKKIAPKKVITKSVAGKPRRKPVSIRILTSDIDAIKSKAAKLGVPYQTYINILIHRDAVGE